MALALGCKECDVVTPCVPGEFEHFTLEGDGSQVLAQWILFRCKAGDHWATDSFLGPEQTALIGKTLEAKHPDSVTVIEQPGMQTGDPALIPLREELPDQLVAKIPDAPPEQS